MISFLSLEYFLVTTEELNFTRAARKLYISQQSLNNHISSLEKEFDMTLFNHTSPLTLIYAGRALETGARELLDLRDETYKEISGIRGLSTRQLSIGVSRMRGRIVLPEILPTYQSQFSGIELHLAEGNPSQLASDLPHGNIDLMIGLLLFTAENMKTVPICNEGILMVAPDEMLKKVYPGQVEEIKEKLRAASDIRLLEHCPSVLLKKESHVRTVTDGIFEDAQMSPRIVLKTEDIEAVLVLSGKGMGITFYSRTLMSPSPTSYSYRSTALEQDHLDLYSLSYTRTHGVLGIGYYKGHYMFRAAHGFIRIVKGWLDCTP